MNIITEIEKAHYVATPEAVESMARDAYEAQGIIGRTTATYFRVLLASVQQELLGKPVLRAARGTLKTLDTSRQLAVFEEVNKRLYEAVMRGVVTPDILHNDGLSTDERNKRTAERNRRGNYARTAASTMRKFIKAGGDVRRVPVPTASKMAMAAATTKAPGASPEDRARRRINRATSRLATVLEELAAEDPALAARALQGSMGKVLDVLQGLGGKTTEKPAQAVKEHRLLKTPDGVFWPMTASPEIRVQ